MRKLTAAALVCCLAVTACGSAAERAGRKQAVIAAALRKLQTEYEGGIVPAERQAAKLTEHAVAREAKKSGAGKRELRKLEHQVASQIATEVAAGTIVSGVGPPPKGISKAEWKAAIKHDHALQRFVGTSGSPNLGVVQPEINIGYGSADDRRGFKLTHHPTVTVDCLEAAGAKSPAVCCTVAATASAEVPHDIGGTAGRTLRSVARSARCSADRRGTLHLLSV